MTAVSIAKTFSASTKKLSANDRGRVLDFLTKFLDDPSSPGLNFETIDIFLGLDQDHGIGRLSHSPDDFVVTIVPNENNSKA